MTEILESAGQYRLRLEIDQWSQSPRTDHDNLCHVITVPGSRYIDVDADGGLLQDGWGRIKERADAVEVFTRWACTFHGAVIAVHTPAQGADSIWYLLPDGIAEVTDPQEYIRGEISEYRHWADGEVYGYTIEKSVTWKRADNQDGEMRTWEPLESCWGYIGHQWAVEAATAEFALYKAEVEATPA